MAIVACTEMSTIDEKMPLPSIDAANVLAGEIVNRAKKYYS